MAARETSSTAVGNSKSAVSTKTMLPIMALYFLSGTWVAANSAMGEIAKAFPEAGAGVAYVSTVASLGMIPTALLSGSVAGKRVSYRTIAIWSDLLYIISGAVPYFMGTSAGFAGLLVSRLVFGLACGLFSPLPNALVAELIADEDKRASSIGLGNAMTSFGGVAATFLAGYVCLISWQSTFLLYAAFGLIVLAFLLLFLHDDASHAKKQDGAAAEADSPSAASEKAERVHVPGVAWGYLIVFTCAMFALGPLQTYCAVIMESSGLGDASVAGICLSLMTVACMVASLVFGRLYKRLKGWMLPFGAAILTCGIVICIIASSDIASLPLWIAGILVFGFGMMTMNVSIPQLLSMSVPPSAIAFVMGLHMVFMHIGTFLSTLYAQLVVNVTGTSDMRTVLMVSTVLFVVIILCYIALVRASNKLTSAQADEKGRA